MKVTCHYCGLPFRVRSVEPKQEYFCCTGCAMIARVPVDAQGQFPINAQLISGLVVGFLYFNQLLFLGLRHLLLREGKLLLADRFGYLALGTALIVWATVVLVQWREKALRETDLAAAVVGLLAHGWIFWRAGAPHWGMAGVNLALILWSLRGVVRAKITRK